MLSTATPTYLRSYPNTPNERLPTTKWLCEDNKNWVEEVPHVLWAHRTTIKISNGHTPFSFTYSTKAVIPVEIGMPSMRCAKIARAANEEALLLKLDVLEEEREKAAIQEAKKQSKDGKIRQRQGP
ncbi:reverse transcriptase domain-containing protein [Tanacetum coccineum]